MKCDAYFITTHGQTQLNQFCSFHMHDLDFADVADLSDGDYFYLHVRFVGEIWDVDEVERS